jgi:hypothetical protein
VSSPLVQAPRALTIYRAEHIIKRVEEHVAANLCIPIMSFFFQKKPPFHPKDEGNAACPAI